MVSGKNRPKPLSALVPTPYIANAAINQIFSIPASKISLKSALGIVANNNRHDIDPQSAARYMNLKVTLRMNLLQGRAKLLAVSTPEMKKNIGIRKGVRKWLI
jgi:hypothetical protein